MHSCGRVAINFAKSVIVFLLASFGLKVLVDWPYELQLITRWRVGREQLGSAKPIESNHFWPNVRKDPL